MVYTTAPALYRAILDAAAASPADDLAHLLPECRPLDADETAAPEWVAIGAQTLDAYHGVRCEDRAGIVGMHAPKPQNPSAHQSKFNRHNMKFIIAALPCFVNAGLKIMSPYDVSS